MLDIYGDPFTDLNGAGYALFTDNSKSAIDFRFVQLHSGEMYLLATHRDEEDCLPIHHALNNEVGSITGNIEDGSKFETCSKPLFKSSRISFPQNKTEGFLFRLTDVLITRGEERTSTRFYLTNLKFIGTEEFIAENGAHMLFLPIEISGIKLRIFPVPNYKYEETILSTTMKPRVTAFVEIPTNDWNSIDAKMMMDNLCWLLSIARGTKINCIRAVGLNEKNGITASDHRAAITWDHTGLPTIGALPHETGDRLKLVKFIESSYERFLELKEKFSIQETIDSIVYAKVGGGFLEFRGLLISSAIDVLRGRWAKEHNRELLFNLNEFRRVRPKVEESVVEALKELISDDDNKRSEIKAKVAELNRPPFEAVLKEMNENLGAGLKSSQITDFKNNRNSLVHNARFLDNNGDYTNGFWRILAFADHLILGLLGQENHKLVWTEGFGIPDL